VSAERKADRGTIGSQLGLLREHIAAAGDELVGEHVDDGQSGARLDRPGLGSGYWISTRVWSVRSAS
jgi:hypothetical protein